MLQRAVKAQEQRAGFTVFLTSEFTQAEAVLITCCSAGWDGGEARIHPTYPGFPVADPSRRKLPVQSAERDRGRSDTLFTAQPGSGGGKHNSDPQRGTQSGPTGVETDSIRVPAEPDPASAPHLNAPAPGALGTATRRAGLAGTRRLPPQLPPPRPRRRPPARSHHRGSPALRSRPVRCRRQRGKSQERGGKRQRRCRCASPPAPT